MEHAGLYPIITNGRCGYIDDRGELRIERRFTYADQFSENLAIVQDNGRYAWIDETGRIVGRDEDGQFKQVYAFRNGRASVELYRRPEGASNFGFIDPDGRLVVEGLGNSRDFHEGLAAVSRGGARWGYIDPDGRQVIPEGEGGPDPFSEGVAANTDFHGRYR